jgi:methylated-DNA-[protein]-cysteine S-methyltransferase
MQTTTYCLFATPLGDCGIAWTDVEATPAVVLVRLPELNRKATALRLARDCGGGEATEPPAEIAALIERIGQHLEGEAQDFRDVALDLGVAGPFARRVYEAARNVLAGETTTYGALARTINRPGAGRAVGQAMGRNPISIIIPCHRVLAAGGKLGGFSAHLGKSIKTRLLAIEGVTV